MQQVIKYVIFSVALSSAIEALKDKGILDEEDSEKGLLFFGDPHFAIWLSNMF